MNPQDRQQQGTQPRTQGQQDDDLDSLKFADPEAKQEARRAGLRADDLRNLPSARSSGITRDDIRQAQQNRGTQR